MLDTHDFLTFMYPAVLFVVGITYVLCAKFSKPNFFIGYRTKLNRKNPTLWKISNFVSGIMFLCFCFFHCCVILAFISIKYIAGCTFLTLTVLILSSQFLFVAELIVVIWATNTFTKWTSKKMKKEITTTEKNSLSDSEQKK